MRLYVGWALLFAAGFTISARADTSVVVTSSAVNADFTVNASDYTTNIMNPGVYTYTDTNAMVNGSPDALTINVGFSLDGNSLNLMDTGSLNEYFDVVANPALFFDPGPPLVFNDGTFVATDFTCALTSDCIPSAASVVATNITPEPSALALFGTGVLGMVGVIRRRVQA